MNSDNVYRCCNNEQIAFQSEFRPRSGLKYGKLVCSPPTRVDLECMLTSNTSFIGFQFQALIVIPLIHLLPLAIATWFSSFGDGNERLKYGLGAYFRTPYVDSIELKSLTFARLRLRPNRTNDINALLTTVYTWPLIFRIRSENAPNLAPMANHRATSGFKSA